MIDCGAIRGVIRPIIHIEVIINQSNSCYPITCLLRPGEVCGVAGISRQTCCELKEGSAGDELIFSRSYCWLD